MQRQIQINKKLVRQAQIRYKIYRKKSGQKKINKRIKLHTQTGIDKPKDVSQIKTVKQKDGITKDVNR